MSVPPLKFLADESCDFAVVRALRAGNYDALASSEVMDRSDDRELIEQADREMRILLTEKEGLVTREQGERMPSAPVVVPSDHVRISRGGARNAQTDWEGMVLTVRLGL